MTKQKFIYGLLSDCQVLFREFQDICLNLNNHLPPFLRNVALSYFEEMTFDIVQKRYILNILHELMDFILDDMDSETNNFTLITLRILNKLSQPNKATVYIPGETRDLEKQRAKIIENGYIPLLAYVAEVGKNQELAKEAKNILQNQYEIHELEWTCKEIERLIGCLGKIEARTTTATVLPIITSSSFYANINNERSIKHINTSNVKMMQKTCIYYIILY